MTRKIEREALDKLANDFMALFPDLEPLSLDEFLYEHEGNMPAELWQVGNKIMQLYPEYGGECVTEALAA